MHRTLERQLQRFADAGGTLPSGSEKLLQAISEAYVHFDENRVLTERSLEISSNELGEINLRLREESAQAKAIVSSMGEGLMVVNRERQVTSANPAAEKLLQIPAGEMLGKTIEELATLFKNDRELTFAERPTARTLQTGEMIAIGLGDDIFLQTHAGRRFPAAISVTALLTAGLPSGAVVIFRDISEERQVNDYIEDQVKVRTHQLDEASARLMASINSLELGFLITEGTSGIAMLNRAAEKVLGLKKQDRYTLQEIGGILGESFALQTEIERSISQKQTLDFESIAFQDTFIRLYISPIVLEEVAIGCAVIIEDITEIKLLERSKDEFFSIASHELRTPLTAIRGYTEVLQTDYAPTLDDPVFNKIIANIDQGSRRLIGIVNDFLNMSGLEQGKISFYIETVELRPTVEGLVGELGPIAAQKGLTLEILWPQWPLPAVRVDHDRLKQVLTNLIGNAMKFTEQGEIILSFTRHNDTVELNVSDTGKGITPQNQHLLFRKFQQAGPNLLTRDTSLGTGLGLYISKLIMEGMNGSIFLKESLPGQGSTFTAALPLAATPHA